MSDAVRGRPYTEFEPDASEAPEPTLVAAGEEGEIFDVPGCPAAGRSGHRIAPLEPDELIAAPHGTQFYLLPGRAPWVAKEHLDWAGLKGACAVAAFVPPRYLVTKLAAFQRTEQAPCLPLLSYAALCWFRGQFHVPAVEVERDPKHDPSMFHGHILNRYVKRLRKKFPSNRLVEHLAENCALRYGCANAMNFFYGRWEMPVPVSPGCNAACVGCISSQPDASISPPQERLQFVPDVAEIIEITVPHLDAAPGAMVSFGQGCEGEPLLHADLIADAIREIRRRTQRGTIHLNTNGSDPVALEKLCEAGLDSVRISVNAFYQPWYNAYYRPKNYSLSDVLESIKVARQRGLFVSINYLSFPGVTDSATETDALLKVLSSNPFHMIQWRNLNIDPDVYLDVICLPKDEPALGLARWVGELRSRFPQVLHGSVNPPMERWPASVREARQQA